MGKPGPEAYRRFLDLFERANAELGLKQYAVPYLMSSHPGSTLDDAIALAEAVRDMGYMPEQVSDFYPTPSTLSTVMWCCGVDPRTMEPVYVARDDEERAMQRALIQYRDPKNYEIVRKALLKAHRGDLIGYGPRCLIRPDGPWKAPGGGSKRNGAQPDGGRQDGGRQGRDRRKDGGNQGDGSRGRGRQGGGRPGGGRPGGGSKPDGRSRGAGRDGDSGRR